MKGKQIKGIGNQCGWRRGELLFELNKENITKEGEEKGGKEGNLILLW